MANYETLKAAIQAVIKTNGNQTITGAVMQSALISMISGLGANMQFAGVATPTTSPGTPDGPTFYLAFQNGTYFNFDKTYLYEKPKVFMWGRPGGPEGAWESVELGVPTIAKYNTDRQLEQNRVNTELAAKANSEDVNNEFAEVRSDLSQKSSMFTGAIMGKGLFYDTNPDLLLKNKAQSLLICFVSPDTKTSTVSASIYDDGYITTVPGCWIYKQQNNGLTAISFRGEFANKQISASKICCIGYSYNPDAGLILSINGVITEKPSPSYRYDHNPTLFRIGGLSHTNAANMISPFIWCAKFDFAMTSDELLSAWNNGHPELWRVPDKYRNAAEGSRCILDIFPASLTPTIWMDVSGQNNNIPYVPNEGNPSECEMAYENMGSLDTIIGTEAPIVIPDFIGQRYIDTTNKVEYTAFGTTSASDWK